MPQRYSAAYVQLLQRGPFPGQIDPWAEAGRYFQQIHSGMIGAVLRQIKDALVPLGYVAVRETSLQITERREPDIHVRTTLPVTNGGVVSRYVEAAQTVRVEPGIALTGELPDLEAIHIRELGSGQLVTMLEIISPSNKADTQLIQEYQERRERLVRHKGVNVVEIDSTRSVKRLVMDQLATAYAYHLVVYLPDELPRLIGVDFGEPLKRLALPLRGEVLPVETQAAYDDAYDAASIPVQLYDEDQYRLDVLPFPSTLTEAQHSAAQDAVTHWQAELQRLAAES
jgi:hypothetical protein